MEKNKNLPNDWRENLFFKCWVSIENSYPIGVFFFIPCIYSSYLFFVTSVLLFSCLWRAFVLGWLVCFTYWYWFWSSRMRISHNYTLDIMCLIHLWSVHCQNPSSLSSIGYQRFARVKYICIPIRPIWESPIMTIFFSVFYYEWPTKSF